MTPDDTVCYCFRVTRRKLAAWARRNRPRVPSQLSGCGGAGTGCGWCVPILKVIFRQETASGPPADGEPDLDALPAEECARRRAEHIRAGRGAPPAGAEPPPPSDGPAA